ncbi:hypothetical protein Poli38472_003848 [Pythium oligandrum]|uniref:WASH complex subunit 3 n=1 Tax=Pythium oligandrum TaxID=41045 RepID=A0A8K1CPL7_PYTOL|nr:hypothetical protein Poli38472_003848 [Pythium oligandrum]|eukprot:TMW66083.1 hypothetical protein Poli38472_003848 [Pythium oligandrum]
MPPSTALVVANGDGDTAARPEEEEVDLPVDLSQLSMIPMPKTLLLVNNFVANTTRFLNHFAHECEERITRVSTNLTRVEIMLAILEAKLNSIPDLTVTESDIDAVDAGDSPATMTPGISIDRDELPSTEPPQGMAPPPPPPPPPPSDFGDGSMPPPPPPPPPGMDSTALVVAPDYALGPGGEAESNAPAILKLKDDPLYAKYFTMRRLGMPDGAIEQKMLMDGVDPSIISMDPEGPSPSGNAAPQAATGPPPLPIVDGNSGPGLPPPPPPGDWQDGQAIPPPFPPPSMPLSPTSSTSSRGHAESLFGDGPPPPPPNLFPGGLPPPPTNPPLPSDDDDSSSDDETVAAAGGGVLKLKDDPAFAKYFAMQKMGLPEGAIRHKLMMDGVTLDILSMDPDGPSPNGGALTMSAPVGGLPPPPLPPSGLPPPPPRPGLPPPPVRRGVHGLTIILALCFGIGHLLYNCEEHAEQVDELYVI